MAKSKKTEEVQPEETVPQDVAPKPIESSEEAVTDNPVVPEEPSAENYPAEPAIETPGAEDALALAKQGEVEFLQNLLRIQEEGGWGRHLHSVITERIKALSK